MTEPRAFKQKHERAVDTYVLHIRNALNDCYLNLVCNENDNDTLTKIKYEYESSANAIFTKALI